MTSTQLRSTGLDDLGTGEPALLLLPGWCGDRSVFEPIAPMLAATRRTVVTDLRGQGDHATDPAMPDFDSTDQVDDLVATLEARGIHSGGPGGAVAAGWAGVGLRRSVRGGGVPGLVPVGWVAAGPPAGLREGMVGPQDPEQWQGLRSALTEMWVSGVEEPAVHDY